MKDGNNQDMLKTLQRSRTFQNVCLDMLKFMSIIHQLRVFEKTAIISIVIKIWIYESIHYFFESSMSIFRIINNG